MRRKKNFPSDNQKKESLYNFSIIGSLSSFSAYSGKFESTFFDIRPVFEKLQAKQK